MSNEEFAELIGPEDLTREPLNIEDFHTLLGLPEPLYDLEAAKVFRATPVMPGRRRWQCVFCAFPLGDIAPEDEGIVAATCCGACGMGGYRPLE